MYRKKTKEPWPLRVYRIGWGQFEGEVRVARLEEDTAIFENGEWVLTSWVVKLEAYDYLDVCRDGLKEAWEPRRGIPRGTRCRFLGYDGDGDVQLKIGSSFTDEVFTTVIFFGDLVFLTLV